MKRKRRQAKASRGKKILAVLLIAVGLCAVAAGIYGFNREKRRASVAGQQEKDAVEQDVAVSKEEIPEESADSRKEKTSGQSGTSDTETKHGQSGSSDVKTEHGQKGTSDAETAAGQSVEPAQEETSGQSEDPEKEERKTISIVGDSISTFKGAIPEGYYDFFPENGTVGSIKETWWRQAFEELNLELCVNASSSGQPAPETQPAQRIRRSGVMSFAPADWRMQKGTRRTSFWCTWVQMICWKVFPWEATTERRRSAMV